VLVALGIAAQLAVVIRAPDTVATCDAVEISVLATFRGAEVPRVTAPGFRPFDLLRAGSPRVDRGARGSASVEYRYTITTDRPGRFTLPPFEARTSRESARTPPLALTVRPARGRAPVVVTRARIDTSAELDVRTTAVAETVFVGQQATYEVAVFLNQTVRERLRRNPTFYPPEMQAMLAYDLPTPLSAVRPRIGSQCFDALVYRRALFPLVAGRIVIPPAQLVYNTGLSPTMYTREESHELQTDSVTIVAVEPPAAGRPAEYAGAVGALRLESRLDSVTPRVGDPVLLTVRVSGSGNVKLFPRPALDVPWAGVIPADERVRVDSGGMRVGGMKEFDWVLTPRLAGEFDVPPVRYGYFDPSRRRYDVATSEARRVRVERGALAASDTGSLDGALGIRMRYSGAAWPPLHSHPAFWLVLALAPLPALVTRARRRPSARGRPVATDPSRALAELPRAPAPAELRRRYVRAIAGRIGCNPEDFTHPGALARALRRAGVSPETAERGETLLRQLDAAAYDTGRAAPTDAARRARDLVAAVDREALSRAELPFILPVIVVAVAVLSTAALAADLASAHFARGVSAYVSRNAEGARASFGDAALMEPRSPDAWANFGTASWTAGDTAAAMYGWRQALALDPTAEDVRQRVALIRDDGPLAPGWVPPLPRDAATWFFAVLWLAGWSMAWLSQGSGRWRWASRWPMPVLTTALVVGAAAIEVESTTAGARLAVVRGAIALSPDPALGMDRGPALGTGEIVRVTARRGGWSLVEATGDRDGWVPSARLLALDERRVPRD